MQQMILLVGVGPYDCKFCKKPIWWVTNPLSGKKIPFSIAGLKHFDECREL